jgi:serine/threonine protein kinase
LFNLTYPFQISKAALSTLECIHNAGILHGDIRCDNILIGHDGITIIDFSHSAQSANEKAKKEELSQLRYFLGLAGKK